MYKFPEHLYTDVRIEDVFETEIKVTSGKLEESKERNYQTAFIRVYDGQRWYYAATSSLDKIEEEIAKLASFAEPVELIAENPVVQKLEVNRLEQLEFSKADIRNIAKAEKYELLKKYYSVLGKRPLLKMWQAVYKDRKVIKQIYSSKGTALKFDTQLTGFSIEFDLADGEKKFSERISVAENYFQDLAGREEEIINKLEKCEYFLKNSIPVNPGKYTVVLAPEVAGVFAHESFGHKSEADFMVGDQAMKKEWVIGKKVGAYLLSIVDDGSLPGSGYTPFDDEGTKAEKTYLIKDGVLQGRLHSAATAASLEEELTGNARAINFEYEPIVRMTATYIQPGDISRAQLFGEIKDGIYVESFKHGSGMSTFTIAPSLAYYIRDGKIAEPVNISVLTGNVMKTLAEIDGLSDQLEIRSSIMGGCGKMEQFPLAVSFGGPYVRIRNMEVQ